MLTQNADSCANIDFKFWSFTKRRLEVSTHGWRDYVVLHQFEALLLFRRPMGRRTHVGVITPVSYTHLTLPTKA